MESALSEIEFLALSANRVAALEALSEEPHTRGELAETIGASQPTLGRVLRDFEERQWVARTDGKYEATATGRLVAGGLEDLLVIMETEAKLRPVMEWLPADAMAFDLQRLREATITVPSRTRPSAPLRRVNEMIREAEDVRVCSHAFNEQSLETIRERVVDGQQRFEGVFSREAIDALAADASLRGRLRELVASPNAAVRVISEEVPTAITIGDGRVQLMLRDEEGALRATIDTDDPEVVSWAGSVHANRWKGAEPLDPEELPH